MNKSLLVLSAGVLLVAGLFAETTRTWEQKGYDDFEKGTLTRLSLNSEGRLQLAPRFRQLADPGLNYVWAMAEDKRGFVYMGGGTPGKVVRVNLSKGRKETAVTPETVLTAKELQVQALAVDDDNNVYAATSPDPKIYKITPDGKSSVFYEPKAKYVWAMVIDRAGNLLVGTGDKGEIVSVDRKGQGKVFYNSDEVHARSLALDRQGSLIVGTDPGGLIIRISPAGQPFILYQAPKKEVTALEIGADGSIYASAVGDKMKGGSLSTPPPQTQPITISPTPVMVGTQAAPAVQGGSEVYRIFPDGEPRRIWTSKDEAVYGLSVRPSGSLLVATGNKGRIYQVDSADVYSNLVKAQATQVTAFLKERGGEILAATGNSGKLMEIGSEYETDGSFESEVFDAHNFAKWGRMAWRAETFPGTSVTFFTRSGNVDNPDRNWSPWSPGMTSPGAKSDSPGARFIQWKAVMTSKAGNTTPWLDSVEIAYLPKNLPPALDEVQATPAGYRFQAALGAAPPATGASITLPALGQPRSSTPPPVPVHFESATTMQQQHGWQGVRWAAHDDNDDTLVYSIYIRGANERNWKLLKDKITDKFYAWDATTFPDGTYFVKVVASDAPSNTEGDALTDEHESGPFIIDNTPPDITNMNAAYDGGKLHVTLRASDVLSTIKKAEYSVDGLDWKLVLPVGQLSDAPQESYDFTVDAKPGEHTVAVRVYDKVENFAVAKAVTK